MSARVAAALILSAALCWTAAALGGLEAARSCAAACAVLTTLVVRTLTRPQDVPNPPRYGHGRTVIRHPYPRFHELTSVISSARTDRRYYDRVLTPLLDQIASDADDAASVDALRAEIADALRRLERRRH